MVLFSSGLVAYGATPGQLIDKAYKDLLKAEHVWDAEERSGLRNRDVAAVGHISGTFDRLRWPSTQYLMTVVIDNKQRNLGFQQNAFSEA